MAMDGGKQFGKVGGAVGSQDQSRLMEAERPPVKPTGDSSCLRQYQGCGSLVPRLKPHFEIKVYLACSHHAKFDRGRPEPPDIVAPHEYVKDDVRANLGEFLSVGPHGCTEETILERTS